MALGAPTVVVETTQAFDRKLAALRSHRSQVGEGDHLEQLLRDWGGQTATAAGLPKGSLAEGFRRVVTT